MNQQRMKKRGTVTERFKQIENYVVECVHLMIHIIEMHLVKL